MKKVLFIADCYAKEVMTNQTKPCTFPFEFGGMVYQGCTPTRDHFSVPWCPTATEEDGTLVQFRWGLCYDRCKMEPNVSKSFYGHMFVCDGPQNESRNVAVKQ